MFELCAAPVALVLPEQYTYGITDVHVLNNKKRMAELSLMGEALDEVTEDNVRSFWGESPFYRKVLNAIRMFRVSCLGGRHRGHTWTRFGQTEIQ